MTKTQNEHVLNTYSSDLYVIFRDGGHNPRTRNAFDVSFVAGITGQDAPSCYNGSAADYQTASAAGFFQGRRLRDEGYSWHCHECGALHSPAQIQRGEE